MKFLISYTNPANAWEQDYPLIGSTVDLNDLDELVKFIDSYEGLATIRLHVAGITPFTPRILFDSHFDDQGNCNLEDDRSYKVMKNNYMVSKLPDDWRSLLWLEIDNGIDE